MKSNLRVDPQDQKGGRGGFMVLTNVRKCFCRSLGMLKTLTFWNLSIKYSECKICFFQNQCVDEFK